jgi:hypothetical protein
MAHVKPLYDILVWVGPYHLQPPFGRVPGPSEGFRLGAKQKRKYQRNEDTLVGRHKAGAAGVIGPSTNELLERGASKGARTELHFPHCSYRCLRLKNGEQ